MGAAKYLPLQNNSAVDAPLWPRRHCARSEAIQSPAAERVRSCFAALARTKGWGSGSGWF